MFVNTTDSKCVRHFLTYRTDPADIKLLLFEIMACRLTADKPSFEPIVT